MKNLVLHFYRHGSQQFINRCIYLAWPLLLMIITLILPYSGDGEEVQQGWADQRLFLNSLQEALSGKEPSGVISGLVGSGYIALGVITTKILGTNPTSSLVILNRFCFIATVLVFFESSRFLVYKSLKSINNNYDGFKRISPSRLAFIYTLILIFSTNFISFSDIPWTHFVATLLSLIVILAILHLIEDCRQKKKSQYFWLSLLGLTLGLLIQVRFFEGIVFLLTLITWLVLNSIVFLFKKIKINLLACISKILLVKLCFFISYFSSLHFSNSKEMNMLYFTLAQKSPYVREFTRIYIDNFPLKFVQLFMDTNFFTMGQSYKIKPLILGFSFKGFRMPLFLQVPILMYVLPILIILILFLMLKNIRFLFSADIFIPLLSGTGLILGYVSSAASGSPHLKYGFVRDFMAPTWSLALITGPWIFYRYLYLYPGNLRKFILLMPSVLPILICILYGQILIKSTTFFQFQDLHIQNIDFKPNCMGLECSIKLKMYNPKKKIIEAPRQRYIINAFCPSTAEEIAITLSSINQTFNLLSCETEYSVNVFPINMGFASTPEIPVSWLFNPSK